MDLCRTIVCGVFEDNLKAINKRTRGAHQGLRRDLRKCSASIFLLLFWSYCCFTYKFNLFCYLILRSDTKEVSPPIRKRKDSGNS